MNILLINRQGNSIASGVASHFENITKILLASGHQVERLVAKEKDLTFGRKVKSHFFNYTEKAARQNDQENKKRILKNRQFFEKALKKISPTSIDLVICANDIYLSVLKKNFDQKKIIVIIPSPLAFSPVCNPLGYKKTVKRMKINLVGVSLVVLSKKMKSLLEKQLGKGYKISVISPGVDLNKFYPVSSIKKSGALYVGRISQEKNIPALISAYSQVKSPEALTLVGGGHLSEVRQLTQKKAAHKKIIFVGKKKRVEKYYRQSKLFLLSSKFEAFGLVIIEAMACGLPVIAFKPNASILTASDEIIKNGINGFLVKDEAEMAKKIDWLLKNSRLRNKLSREAIRTAQKFNWDDHVKKLLSL